MMNVVKFELGENYIIEFPDDNYIGQCVEIKETLSGKEVVFEVGYQYYRCEVYDSYEPTTCLYSEQADFCEGICSFAAWKEVK